MLLILLTLLAAIAVHRIWHYEDIFAPLRSTLGAKLLIDPTWTPLWIAPFVACVALLPRADLVLAALACYPPLRGMVWLYERYDPRPVACSPCAARKKRMDEDSALMRSFSKRVLLIGSEATARALAKAHKDWLIIVLFGKHVSVGVKGATDRARIGKNIIFRDIFSSDVNTATMDLTSTIMTGGNATVVVEGTHPFAAPVIRRLSTMQAVAWVHRTDETVDVPAHHRVVVPGAALDTVIADAAPPPPPKKP